MSPLDEDGRLEYTALMGRGRDAERTAQLCWTAGGVSAAVLLSWAIAARNSGLMLPVVFALAFGFYATLRARQQVRLIAGYVEEFFEDQGGGPQWFTRVHRLQHLPGFSPSGDWLTAILVNAGVVIAVVLAWVFAAAAPRGDLMAGIVTGCGVGFAFHSLFETSRLIGTNASALWRQVSGELREQSRAARLASR